ncbi:MAG: DUF4810 domain-containing protein [Methylocystaceae bacterium]|nr:DUF4810 domain-containing protein [Methylocystaceae bacterium]
MKKNIIKAAILLSALGLGACQPATLYNWGDYDSTMLAYYKDASKIDAFEAELFALIQQSETSDKRLAPGIFAEYGFLQMQKGDNKSAVKFFELEKKNWPESKILMETMIRAAGGSDSDKKEAKTQGNQTNES